MSLRINILFNYIGQFYSIAIGILVLPLFLKHMGSEAYGLVGVFTLIQSLMQLLDMGITPTLSREISRLKNKEDEHQALLSIVNTFEVCFFIISIFVGGGLFLTREWVATKWLVIEGLDFATVSTALGTVSIIVIFRCMSSLNRSGIYAYESQVWINVFDIVVNTLRFPVALFVVVVSEEKILCYFYYVLFVAIIEIVVLRFKLRKLLPNVSEFASRFSVFELKRSAPFALSIGYTTMIWVFLTQIDKLLLSNRLTLSEYGYFSLVATISSGLILISSPISKAILPRMVELLANGKDAEMIKIYRFYSKIVVSVIAPIASIIVFFPEVVVFVWTGDRIAAKWASSILRLYVGGSALLTLISFQYCLQYAYGNLKYHVRYHTGLMIVTVPIIIYLVSTFGALGAGIGWLSIRVFTIIFWAGFIHHKFAPNIHKKWLVQDISPGFSTAILMLFVLNCLFPLEVESSRILNLSYLIIYACLTIILSLAVSLRSTIFAYVFEGNTRSPMKFHIPNDS